jgi:Sulfotransferase domain
MPGQQFSHKILWLASYPKSGNTWFRAFLSALMNNGEVEINKLKTGGMFSSRETFDSLTDISSRDLYDTEAKSMIADVYRNIAAETDALSIIKVHDAFECDAEGKNIIPEDVTHCALYFIRNPLDIAGSLANHMPFSIEEAVDMLNDNKACMAYQPDNFNKNIQLSQHLSCWSGHVNSWTSKPSFPVCVIRYEDMLSDTFETFDKGLKFIGWHYHPHEIINAIAKTGFDELSKQEEEKGFYEKANKSPKFFRTGTMGNWEKELSPEQVNRIIQKNKSMLDKYQYLNNTEKAL